MFFFVVVFFLVFLLTPVIGLIIFIRFCVKFPSLFLTELADHNWINNWQLDMPFYQLNLIILKSLMFISDTWHGVLSCWSFTSSTCVIINLLKRVVNWFPISIHFSLIIHPTQICNWLSQWIQHAQKDIPHQFGFLHIICQVRQIFPLDNIVFVHFSVKCPLFKSHSQVDFR